MKTNEFDAKFEIVLKNMLNSYHSWRWIPIVEELPKMCKDVIVLGIIDKVNISLQAYQARRWTGWTSGWPGISEGKAPPWEWLTPQDIRIADVRFWMPMPTIDENIRGIIHDEINNEN